MYVWLYVWNIWHKNEENSAIHNGSSSMSRTIWINRQTGSFKFMYVYATGGTKGMRWSFKHIFQFLGNLFARQLEDHVIPT